MVQRYKFESKSQQAAGLNPALMSCFQWFKDTNLKVNHNMLMVLKFESKSQHVDGSAILTSGCFQWFKDTNLKVNHNEQEVAAKQRKLFPMVQRYKFESKSQRLVAVKGLLSGCFQWFKDTNLKVNHNSNSQ